MSKPKTPGRRKPSEQLRTNKRDYPRDGTGRSYAFHDIPQDVWAAAAERAQVERVGMRWVLIRLLDQFGKGTVSP
jgi:hypothetical protein